LYKGFFMAGSYTVPLMVPVVPPVQVAPSSPPSGSRFPPLEPPLLPLLPLVPLLVLLTPPPLLPVDAAAPLSENPCSRVLPHPASAFVATAAPSATTAPNRASDWARGRLRGGKNMAA
jgi:hypothetical protein